MSGEHHVPFSTYLKILMTLLFLTVVTVLVAKPVSGVDFGILNTFIAMLIATVKATLVAMYFMHLKYDDKTFAVIMVGGVFFLIVFFTFSAMDVFTRIGVDSTL